LIGRDLVQEVTCQNPYEWGTGNDPQFSSIGEETSSIIQRRFKVVVLDFGVKYNILRSLRIGTARLSYCLPQQGQRLFSRISGRNSPSNGPGDPEGVPYAIETVRQLLGEKPIFGICLGHQLLGLAFGGKTFKLKFGHRGANQPVKDLKTGKVSITSQNHGFCVDLQSLNPNELN